jgi:SAM-dependent methyltransferase
LQKARGKALSKPLIFDNEHYEQLNSSRGAVVASLLADIKSALQLGTAIDVGCGLGYFSGLLHSSGLSVVAADGRQQNIDEASRRHPGISFSCCDVQSREVLRFGKFDLVFCFGLVYHLENPLLAIRQLHEMTGKLLLVESVIFPGEEPVMALIEEEIHDDQGLNHIAFYPTEACLIKMLYRSGFPFVFQFVNQPDHPHYHASREGLRVRTMLAASRQPLHSSQLKVASEPSSRIRPWDPKSGLHADSTLEKLKWFADQPIKEKMKVLKKFSKSK